MGVLNKMAEKKENKKEVKVIAYVFVMVMFVCIFVTFWILMGVNHEVAFECSVGSLDYVDLPDNVSCWDSSFSDDFCPLPSGEISCSGSVEVPLAIFMWRG